VTKAFDNILMVVVVGTLAAGFMLAVLVVLPTLEYAQHGVPNLEPTKTARKT